MKVLVAIDATPTSRDAIELAKELLPAESDAIVLNVAIADAAALSPVGILAEAHAFAAASDPVAADMADPAAPAVVHRAADALDAEAVITTGDPAERIIDTARTHGVDLIIVGTRDKGPVERFFTGSVSRHVLDHAPCSVLVAR